MFLPFPHLKLAIQDWSKLPEQSFLVFPQAAHSAWLELAFYLGDRFRVEWMGTTDADMDTEAATYPTMGAFYQSSERYLYHLTTYFLEGWKRPGYALLFQLLASVKNVSILDYGCGIGSDGLWFMDQGFDVDFADYDNPSRRYLAWRLAHRMQRSGALYGIDDGTVIPPHDVCWCMDVLEHTPPSTHRAFLDHLATLGMFVIMNLVDDRTADGRVHYPVDVEGLTAWLAERYIVTCKDFYEKPDGSKVRFLLYRNRTAEDKEE